MRCDYAHIFLGYEPESNAACGLSYGYMRFLFQLASDYHSFWVDGDRVTLSDSENQLIENGTAVLADMMINGCVGASPMVQVVDWEENGQSAPSAGGSAILRMTGTVDTNYFSVGSQLVCQTAGLYLVSVAARPRDTQVYFSVVTPWELRILHNLSIVPVSRSVYVPTDKPVTAEIVYAFDLAVGDTLLFHVFNGSTEGPMYFFEDTRLQIWAL